MVIKNGERIKNNNAISRALAPKNATHDLNISLVLENNAKIIKIGPRDKTKTILIIVTKYVEAIISITYKK